MITNLNDELRISPNGVKSAANGVMVSRSGVASSVASAKTPPKLNGRHCLICNNEMTGRQMKYCSNRCKQKEKYGGRNSHYHVQRENVARIAPTMPARYEVDTPLPAPAKHEKYQEQIAAMVAFCEAIDKAGNTTAQLDAVGELMNEAAYFEDFLADRAMGTMLYESYMATAGLLRTMADTYVNGSGMMKSRPASNLQNSINY